MTISSERNPRRNPPSWRRLYKLHRATALYKPRGGPALAEAPIHLCTKFEHFGNRVLVHFGNRVLVHFGNRVLVHFRNHFCVDFRVHFFVDLRVNFFVDLRINFLSPFRSSFGTGRRTIRNAISKQMPMARATTRMSNRDPPDRLFPVRHFVPF